MVRKKLAPVHPGEILEEEFLQPRALTLTQYRLATGLKVPARRIHEIVQQQSLERLVLALIREHGEPTKEERAWARGALAGRRSRG